jgi:hypothetical protein
MQGFSSACTVIISADGNTVIVAHIFTRLLLLDCKLPLLSVNLNGQQW